MSISDQTKHAAAHPEPLAAASQSMLPFDSTELCSPLGNQLIARFPVSDMKRLRPELQAVWLVAGVVEGEAYSRQSHVLFPVHAVVSLQAVLSCGAGVEFAGVGNEGYMGLGATLPGSRLPWRAVVQTGGLAFRMPAKVLSAEFERGGIVARTLLGNSAGLLTQMAMILACNRRHTLEEQMCRWLLLTLDRLPANQIVTTQELIAGFLGVRREGVTEVAGRLQRAGVITYRRGRIDVTRRDMLEERSCECYGVIHDEFHRLRDA